MHNARVIELAESWLGTPYRHQASVKGVGCDCIGLIIGVWKELYGYAPADFVLPPYSARWAEETGEELMVTTARKHLIEIPVSEKQPGDVVMYRMFKRSATKHAAILVSPTEIIHAYNGHDVRKTDLISNVGSAITYAFKYPETVE